MYLKNKVDKAIKVIATSENVKKFDSISNRFWKLGKRYGKKNFESKQFSGVIATAVMAAGERISDCPILIWLLIAELLFFLLKDRP